VGEDLQADEHVRCAYERSIKMKKTSKKMIAMLVCLVLIIGAMAVSALAAETVARGECGDALTWVLTDDGVLTISGEGEMGNYDAPSVIAPPAFLPKPVQAPWYEYRTQIKTVVIENGVTTIGTNAFYGCSELTDITIPNSVTEIKRYAFEYCTSLVDITIPNSVTELDISVFLYCEKLESVTLPNGLTELPAQIFYGCTSLKNVTIPENVTVIGSGAFWYCSGLNDVTIPANVTVIESYAFAECTSLTSFVIPENVATVEDGIFQNCASLISVTLPDDLTEIGSYLFSGCASLTGVTIPETVTNIQSMAFEGCSSLESIVIPAGVTEIGIYAFEGCASLTEITIPAAVKSIGAEAFSNCYGLTKITVAEGNENYCSDEKGVLFNKDKTILIQAPGGLTGSYVIPNGVTNVENGAFAGCASLAEIIVPASVTALNSFNTFGSCTSLERIIVYGDNPNYMNDESGVLYNKDKTALIEAPRKLKGSYVIPEGVNRIYNCAFENCDALTDVTIPASVTSIDYSAFGGCENLTAIKVHEDNPNYSNDESGALYRKGIISLEQVPGGLSGSYTVLDGTDSISLFAFLDCDKLTEINLPDSITYIGDHAFKGCTGITEITIPGSVEIIEDYAFMNCKNLKTIKFLGDAPSINDYTFETVTAIGYYPDNTDTWQRELELNAGKNITWIPYTPGEDLPYIKGDVSLDGEISNSDLVMMARYIVGAETDENIKTYGDMDEDGKVTNSDLVALARIIVGIVD